MARALRTSRPGACRGGGGQATEKRVKITAGRGWPRHVAKRGMKNTAGGSMGVERALTCIAQNPKLAERGVKTLLGGRCGGLAVGCQKIYLRPTFFA